MAEQHEQQKSSLQALRELGEKAISSVGNFIKEMGLPGADGSPVIQESPIGATHLEGMARKGLSELAQYLPAFNQAGTQVTEDIAIWPNQTQGEIAQARGGPGSGPEQESPQQNQKLSLDDLKKFADERSQAAEQKMNQQNDQGRGM